ncbi:MAG: ComEC/Rec2 family competence protein [Bacteroidales bacterium]|nr:ComEC/Rec2 family competence protein [Bacteroidales bacterium]
MLYKEIPFTGYCIALATGIICGSFMHSVFYCNAAVIILASALLILLFAGRQRRSSTAFGLILHCCIFFTGCSLSISQKNKLAYISPGPHTFVVRTDNYPAPASRSLKIHAGIISVDSDDKYKNNRLLLYTGDRFIPRPLQPGTIISFVSAPVEITDFDDSDNFDYQSYMNRRGFRYTAFCYDSISVIDERPTIRHLGLRLRRVLFGRLESTLDDEKSLAVVSAMTLGYRDLLDDRIKEEFRRSGIIHIMAVSGLHVGIISLIILSLLKIIQIRSGPARLLLSLAIIWSYALVSGLSPSVTRASVMFSFLNTGYLINRPAKPLNSVMASAFILLIARPTILYEASFLLSYSAVIAIVTNYRDMVSLFNFRGLVLDRVWKMVVISLLAQAGTLPFVALFFGEIPLFSVLSNLFAIPLAMVILSTGFVLIFTSSLPLIPSVVSKILTYCVHTLNDAAASIASLNSSVIQVNDITPLRTIILFCLILATLRFLLAREKNNPHIPLIICIIYYAIP